MGRVPLRALLAVVTLVAAHRLGGGEIHTAVEAGDVAKVRALLAADPSLAAAPEPTADRQPLHLAAAAGQLELMTMLLAAGAAVDALDRAGATPLHKAAEGLRLEAVALLLDRGAKPDTTTRNGYTALALAISPAQASHPPHDDARAAAVVALLLKRGASHSLALPDGSTTPLDLAVIEDMPACATALLDAGAPVDPPRDDRQSALAALTPLGRAAATGTVRTAKVLLAHHARLESGIPAQPTPAVLASSYGQREILKMVLDAGAQTTPLGFGGRTCLHAVAMVPSWEATQLSGLWQQFSQAALNPAAVGDETVAGPLAGVPPATAAKVLAMVAEYCTSLDRPVDFPGCAQVLVDHGVPSDVKDNRGATPLHLAARVGNLDAVGWLLDHGAKVGYRDPEGYSALEFAAEKGQAEAVRLLLVRGADLHGRTRDRSDAVHLAAQSGHAETVRALLERGAPADSADEFGATPLLKACFGGHLEAARLLLAAGADANATSTHGWTPLQRAALGRDGALLLLDEGRNRAARDGYVIERKTGSAEDYQALVELLLAHHPDVGAKDKEGFTPLHEAAYGGDVSIMKLLLEKGANANAPNADGNTPLHEVAIGVGNAAAAELLLAAGARVDTRCRSGGTFYRQTPLIDAAGRDCLPVVKCLLAHGADVNARDDNGATALHWAVLRGKASVADALLAGGADPDAADGNGRTPIDIARDQGGGDLLERLLRTPTHPAAGPAAAPTADLAPLRAAAEAGDADAQCRLAGTLISGPFNGRDPAQGVEWYTKAAQRGSPEALYALGLAYYRGKVVTQDLVKAYGCILAAEKRLAVNGKRFDKDQVKAAQCIREQITRQQKRDAEHEADRLCREAGAQ